MDHRVPPPWSSTWSSAFDRTDGCAITWRTRTLVSAGMAALQRNTVHNLFLAKSLVAPSTESRSSAPRVIGHAGAAERRCPCPLLMRRHSHAHRTSCAACQSTIRHLLLAQSLVAPSDWNQTVPSCTMDHQSTDSRLHFRQANARPSQSRGHGALGSSLGLRCPWDIIPDVPCVHVHDFV